MVLSNLELYARITAHELDLIGSQLSFSDRLARENDWSLEFTAQAIIEYKKFCYLAMTAPHEVTPSDEVDQVWHLHLLYTRDYWGTFCPDVLKKTLASRTNQRGSKRAPTLFGELPRNPKELSTRI